MLSTSNFFKTVLLVSLGICTVLKTHAQFTDELPAKKNSFKFTPQNFVVSTFMLSYERYIASSISLQVTGGLMSAQKKS